MSNIGLYLLAISAFIGTVLTIVPGTQLGAWAAARAEATESVTLAKALWDLIKVCGVLLLLLLHVMFVCVIQPFFVLYALINSIGLQTLTYGMFVIVAVDVIYMIMRMVDTSKSNRSQLLYKGITTILTANGRNLKGAVVDTDSHSSSLAVLTFRRFLFFVPKLYLWYLLFVVLG